MRQRSPAPTLPRRVKLAVGIAMLFATGLGASTISTSSAATAADCIVIQCPTISTPTLPTISTPTLPTISTPLGTTSTTTPSTTSAPAPTPSGSTLGGPTPGGPTPGGPTPPASGQSAATPSAFSYTVARVSLKRTAGVRRLSIEVSLSQPATIVSVLHRGGVPSLVDVRGGRAGTTTWALTLNRRIKAGRYTLRLVFAKAEEHYTYTRRVAVPK
jgi:hypothetical protein